MKAMTLVRHLLQPALSFDLRGLISKKIKASHLRMWRFFGGLHIALALNIFSWAVPINFLKHL